MTNPTQAQINAAVASARQAIQNYSQLYSDMIADETLTFVVQSALIAALNVPTPSQRKNP